MKQKEKDKMMKKTTEIIDRLIDQLKEGLVNDWCAWADENWAYVDDNDPEEIDVVVWELVTRSSYRANDDGTWTRYDVHHQPAEDYDCREDALCAANEEADNQIAEAKAAYCDLWAGCDNQRIWYALDDIDTDQIDSDGWETIAEAVDFLNQEE